MSSTQNCVAWPAIFFSLLYVAYCQDHDKKPQLGEGVGQQLKFLSNLCNLEGDVFKDLENYIDTC